MRFRSLLLIALLFASACNEGRGSRPGATTTRPAEASTPAPAASPSFPHAKVLIDTDEGSVIVDAEKAETPEQRQVGLMFRESLGEREGMVFLFFEEVTSAFYMKNTFIPLSIAFFDGEGTIIDIQHMEPCERDPCPLYEPPAPYQGALEVNQGAFEEWGVEIGDRITVSH